MNFKESLHPPLHLQPVGRSINLYYHIMFSLGRLALANVAVFIHGYLLH